MMDSTLICQNSFPTKHPFFLSKLYHTSADKRTPSPGISTFTTQVLLFKIYRIKGRKYLYHESGPRPHPPSIDPAAPNGDCDSRCNTSLPPSRPVRPAPHPPAPRSEPALPAASGPPIDRLPDPVSRLAAPVRSKEHQKPPGSPADRQHRQ